MRILVVDDEELIASLLAMILKSEGHKVTTASDGNAALAKALENAYDLVITDFNMPGIDGLTLAKRIKAERPAQKIILLSGTGGPGTTTPDVDEVLSKPIKPEVLTECVGKFAAPA